MLVYNTPDKSKDATLFTRHGTRICKPLKTKLFKNFFQSDKFETPATLRFIEAGQQFYERTFLKHVLNWTFKEGDLRCTVDRKDFIRFLPHQRKIFHTLSNLY